MLTFRRLNNSIPFITIKAECMLMLTNQSLCWCLDLLGENSLILFFSTMRCVSLQFSAKQDIHSYLQHHKTALENGSSNDNSKCILISLRWGWTTPMYWWLHTLQAHNHLLIFLLSQHEPFLVFSLLKPTSSSAPEHHEWTKISLSGVSVKSGLRVCAA